MGETDSKNERGGIKKYLNSIWAGAKILKHKQIYLAKTKPGPNLLSKSLYNENHFYIIFAKRRGATGGLGKQKSVPERIRKGGIKK